MNYQLILILSCAIIKICASNINMQLEKQLIDFILNSSALEDDSDETDDDDENKKITCRCNICVDAYYCLTDGGCFISSKYNQQGQKIYTQGCIDRDEPENSVVSHFCREDDSFPERYERRCCFKNLCNGNATIPYTFDDIYSTENIYLLASVCAVIFLTLIAFILFFSCRLDMR